MGKGFDGSDKSTTIDKGHENNPKGLINPARLNPISKSTEYLFIELIF